jgi:hypothetical protein
MACNNIVLDVAVIGKEILPIEIMSNSHIVELDEIPISETTFKNIFYPYGETFGIDKSIISNNTSLMNYITFLTPWRTVKTIPFSLNNTIISNIETDLNVSRSCFTICSLLDLTKELCSINSLCDINCCSVVCALTWSDIMNILKNEYFIEDNTTIKMYLVINVLFKSPNTCILPTIIKFRYVVDIYTSNN